MYVLSWDIPLTIILLFTFFLELALLIVAILVCYRLYDIRRHLPGHAGIHYEASEKLDVDEEVVTDLIAANIAMASVKKKTKKRSRKKRKTKNKAKKKSRSRSSAKKKTAQKKTTKRAAKKR